jgi:predicted glycosyltransferase
MKPHRLDLLIYAHDGRGLGHASRSIAVGIAHRRLYPQMRVLFVSGCRQSRDLIAGAPLDWIKLPAYETEVIQGKSRGIRGRSNYSDGELGNLRAQTLAHLINLYRPRLVLSDHTPQGKHKELRLALEVSREIDTQWVLGVRGVIGSVPQVQSDLARTLFRDHYRAILWYGDSKVLGVSHMEQLSAHFGVDPIETGYVSRLGELLQLPQGTLDTHADKALAGTVSIPWVGEKTLAVLNNLAGAIAAIGEAYGNWHLYLGSNGDPKIALKIRQLFASLPHCSLRLPGAGYPKSLLSSRMALIYGGYNSLVDVLYGKIPAVVVLRAMQDEEQKVHIDKLSRAITDALSILHEEAVDTKVLEKALRARLEQGKLENHGINLVGASNASRFLATLMDPDIE